MKYLVTLLVYLWFSTALVVAESNEAQTSEKQKEDCVFEVLPRHGANTDQLDRDLDTKLAQFDACLESIESGAQGQGQAGQKAVPNSQGQGGEAESQNNDATGSEASSSDSTDLTSNEEETSESTGVPSNLNDKLPSPEDKKNAVATNALPSDTKDVQNRLREDDFAKVLREAAEKETDPTRKASLYKNYEDYMANRKK